MFRWKRNYLIATVIIAVILLGFVFLIWPSHSSHPYGWSCCCLRKLNFALECYANANEGRFPAGGDTPEASLSFLYPDYIDAETLKGNTVPLGVVKNLFKQGKLLGPDTCGWHYVEGLTLADDPNIALVWDKVGLGNDGKKLSYGGHTVTYIGSGEKIVPESDWPEFLKRQKHLLANRDQRAIKGIPALTAKIRLPSGELVDSYNGDYSLNGSFRGTSGCGSESTSGNFLKASQLRWYRLSTSDGTIEFTLTLNGWNSEPVSVTISDGKATPDSIIFEMKAIKDTSTKNPQSPPPNPQSLTPNPPPPTKEP